jgi:hypothetical protein
MSMKQLLGSIGDRMLAAFLPQERAGACPCQGGGEGHYEYRCSGHLQQRRWCVDTCNCGTSCGSWQTTFTTC